MFWDSLLQAEEVDEGIGSGRSLLKENPNTLTTVSYSATSLNSDCTDEREEGPRATVNHLQNYTSQANNEEEVMDAVGRSRNRRSFGKPHDIP